ncbi:MAG: dihydrodipicolinate synthase family protein, partial [Gemmatimonadales bacterium]
MPRPTELGGVMVPVVTTFDARGESLDAAAFTSNIEAYIDAGVSGIVVAGSSGEAPFLTDAERTVLVEAARGVVPAGRWLIAGVGSESTRQTVERAREAARRGADAVLVVAPHYFPQSTTADALVAHYERVADESPVPVLLYSIPQYMHFVLPAAVVARLAEHANVIGMKDSGGDAAVLAGYLASQSPSFSVLTGHGGTLVTTVAAGVRGGILGVGLIVPALTLAAFEAARARHTTDAAALQAQLLPLAREVVGALGPAGIKAAMDAAGLRG